MNSKSSEIYFVCYLTVIFRWFVIVVSLFGVSNVVMTRLLGYDMWCMKSLPVGLLLTYSWNVYRLVPPYRDVL